MPNFSLLLVILCIVNNCQCVLGFVVPQHRIITINISPRSSLHHTQCQHHFNHHRHQQQLKQRQNSLVLQGKLLGSCLYSNADNSEEPSENDGYDPVIRDVAVRLRRVNWISWWSQVILTVISSITLLFARSVLNAVSGAVVSPTGSAVPPSTAPGGFVFAGSGIVLSYLSIIWTWGGTRLSRRLRRNSTKNYSRIKSATMIRRAIVIGVTLNLLGMLVTLIGAEQIVGLLAAKVLTMQGITPFQASFGLGLGGGSGGLGAQSVQPLDVLIVQANTNTLLSHFLSLVGCLVLTRSVHVLDPPSVEDDER